jgi:hypothetical protein
VLLPCLNWLLMPEMLRLLLLPGQGDAFAAPARGEMQLLTGFAWLANYSPVRPGLFFRLWWHASKDGIPMSRSVRSVAAGIMCGCLSVGLLLACCWMVPAASAAPVAWTLLALAMPPATFMAASMIASRRDSWWRWFRYGRRGAESGRDGVDGPVRDRVRARGRTLAGHPRGGGDRGGEPGGHADSLAGQRPGVREVAIGLAAAWLPSWYAGGDPKAALAADLVNRAGEVAGALVVGSVSGWLLWRRARTAT